MTNLDVALSYLKKGFSVMPIWSPEAIKQNPGGFNEKLDAELKKNDETNSPLPEEEISQRVLRDFCKAPLLPHWKVYQKRLPSPEEVTEWFTQYPKANIAIITGKVSGVVVFDVDAAKGIEYGEKNGGFPVTARVKTGKGYHYYMKHPGDDPIKNRVNPDLTIDIRADGGYVVAPPSTHGSGRQYQWVEGASIYDLDPAECSSWMLDYLHKINVEASKKTAHTDLDNTGDGIEHEDRTHNKQDSTPNWAEILMKGCEKGDRNQRATQLIGHLFKTTLDEKEIWAMAVIWNRINKPPMDPPELKKTFDSVKAMELESAQKGIDIETLLDTSQKVVKEYEENYVRIPFGGNNLTLLERKMEGGLVGGRLYILGGIPTSGKTLLMNNIADNICLSGMPVLVFSYDDGRTELLNRTFARICKVPIKSLNSNSCPKMKDLCHDPQIKKIHGLKYVVEEMIPIEQWGEIVEKVKTKTNHSPVIIIDYLRKLRTGRQFHDERLRIDDIVSNLTSLAKAHNIPIVAISELARDSYKSGQCLSMASFKESGMIEYEASWLGILAPVEETDHGYQVKSDWETIIQHDGNLDLIVFKAKRGTGDPGRIPLKVDKKFMTVTDRDQDHDKQNKKSSKYD
jgi:replicative DNA helicase